MRILAPAWPTAQASGRKWRPRRAGCCLARAPTSYLFPGRAVPVHDQAPDRAGGDPTAQALVAEVAATPASQAPEAGNGCQAAPSHRAARLQWRAADGPDAAGRQRGQAHEEAVQVRAWHPHPGGAVPAQDQMAIAWSGGTPPPKHRGPTRGHPGQLAAARNRARARVQAFPFQCTIRARPAVPKIWPTAQASRPEPRPPRTAGCRRRMPGSAPFSTPSRSTARSVSDTRGPPPCTRPPTPAVPSPRSPRSAPHRS